MDQVFDIVSLFELRIAESVFGVEDLECRLTSWIALRSALGISMIAIYLPTTWVICLGRRIETQGEVGSRCRDGGMISLDGYGMPGPQLCGPFRASTHLFFAAAGRRYKTPYCGNLVRLGGGVAAGLLR